MKTLRKIRQIIKNLTDDISPETRKLLPMGGILLLALVLIIIIVIAQSCGHSENAEPEETEFIFEDVIEETISPLSDSEGIDISDETDSQEDEADYGNLKKNSDPALLDVMERYFFARANGDLDTVNELYGITDQTEEERNEDLEVLQFNARYISSFDNITTYVMDGPYEDCWLVYTTTDINFYTCSTKAPTIMWCFIEKTGDDEYHIVDSHGLTAELNEYAEEENHTPEVRALAADVNDRLVDALESDPELEETYGILRSGSPLWDNTSEAETEVAIVEEEPSRTEAAREEISEAAVSEEDTEEAGTEENIPAETIEPFGSDSGGDTENITPVEGPAGDLTPIEAGAGPGDADPAAAGIEPLNEE